MNLKKNIFLFFFILLITESVEGTLIPNQYESPFAPIYVCELQTPLNLGKILTKNIKFKPDQYNKTQPNYKKISSVKLISPYRTISKQVKKIPIGLWVTIDKGWHSYWQYPGESGKPLQVKWTLPQDSVVSPLQWPIPERIHFGSLINFGYKHSFLLMSEWSLPEKKPYKTVNIQAEVEWLICKEVCVPLTQSVSLDIPITPIVSENFILKKGAKKEKNPESYEKITLPGNTLTTQKPESQQNQKNINTHWLSEFNRWSTKIPKVSKEKIHLQSKGMSWLAHISTKEIRHLVDIFPLSKRTFSLKPPTVVSTNSYKHFFLINPAVQENIPHSSTINKNTHVIAVFEEKGNKSGFIYSIEQKKISVFWFLLLAFLGGLILNFMPCVLPIVFLKFSNTLEATRQSPSVLILGNIFYSLGVILSFILLAFVLLLFKKGGESIGWGFQMQSPYFLLSIILLFVLISLGFMGWFSISIPSIPFFHRGQNYFKHFLTGILSTTAASPCTAPFMGAAIGYAFSGSVFQIVMIFLCLGLGLSFPYLLLSVFPKWVQYVPLPGSWSHKLKHFMAFPMLATSAWLIYLFNQQMPESLLSLLLSLLLLAFGFWLLNNIKKGSLSKWFFRLIILVALIYPFLLLYGKTNTAIADISWEPFSIKKMEYLRSEEQAVFINFTADWCLTCKFNERVTFKNKKVIQFFKEKNIRALKGDWTNKNPEITTLLDRYHRSGIPFYLYFPAGERGASATLLPELLTPGVFFRYVK
ncbi:MAG: protein-disulfide reductase DsbD family protein [Bdellovibrionales bacterium]|nr:protein-disulfide reductase DsbD family protein [Bdellovibrionales bacterium]